jgi:thiamine pyrophosphate-dependent acetolactate synthase large subunit-like protein
VIILDNRQYGAVLRHANAGNRDLSVSQAHQLGGLDFVALATAQGVTAHRTDTLDALREHLCTAIGAKEPVLLWVPVAGVPTKHSTGPAPQIHG